MRRIVFTSRKIPNNSFYMRGEQMCHALQKLGHNAIIMNSEQTNDCHDDIVIFVRRTPGRAHLQKLRKHNIIVFDPLDSLVDLHRLSLCDVVDAVIYPSKYQCKTDNLYQGSKYWLLHHYDPRLTQHKFNKFVLGYWGYSTSADHTRALIKRANRYTSTKNFPSEDFFNRISCHYSVRRKERGLGWRPTTKISTAAACGANIIVAMDKMSRELLPRDYPYWITNPNSLEHVKSVVNKAHKDFGNNIWQYGLECMDKVKNKTHIKRCANVYSRILEEVNGKFNTNF